jgi:hypothetical protein
MWKILLLEEASSHAKDSCLKGTTSLVQTMKMIRPNSEFKDPSSPSPGNHGATTLFDGSYQDGSAVCGASHEMRDNEVHMMFVASVGDEESPQVALPSLDSPSVSSHEPRLKPGCALPRSQETSLAAG